MFYRFYSQHWTMDVLVVQKCRQNCVTLLAPTSVGWLVAGKIANWTVKMNKKDADQASSHAVSSAYRLQHEDSFDLLLVWFSICRCMYEPPHFTAMEVSTFKCDLLVRPESYAKCHITCPGECVVSPWSDWSSCNSPCRQGSKQQKTRVVLRAPAIHASFKCPPLIEVSFSKTHFIN